MIHLCLLLNKLGADIYGYALEPVTKPSLYKLANIDRLITSHIGDIKNQKKIDEVITRIQPEIVIHMAAQPLVGESYKNPIETYAVNVIGTLNLLEACKKTKSIKVIVNVTSDKCYENKEWNWAYRENEPLGGHDPYSSSKGCSELLTSSYRNSYFNSKNYIEHGVAIATARAGNVIGGGDWADERLIPDFIRAITQKKKVKIRCPYAIRPWQHVLEPLSGYLLLAEKLYSYGSEYAEAWNFGPDDRDAKSVESIIKYICQIWGDSASYVVNDEHYFHEANYLKLDSSKAKTKLKWSPKWNIEKTLQSIVDWNKAYLNKKNMKQVSEEQIDLFFNF